MWSSILFCYRFTLLDKLGNQIMKVLPESVTIAHKVKKMNDLQQELLNGWDKRNKQLEDALDLAVSRSDLYVINDCQCPFIDV